MKRIGPDVFVPPMSVALVGAIVEGKANFMTVGWCTQANANPPVHWHAQPPRSRCLTFARAGLAFQEHRRVFMRSFYIEL